MANVYVNNLGVPRKARNGRIYGGVSFNSTNVNQSGSTAPAKHFENGKITNVTSHDITIYYTTPFKVVPTGISNISVYRFYYGPDMGLPVGTYIKQDVLWYFPNSTAMLNLDSFSITIDSSENLTGVIIEYLITE